MSDALRPGGTPHQETSPKNAAKLSFPSAGTPSAGPPQIGAAPAAAWREGTVGADRPRSRPSNQGPGGSPWPFQKHDPTAWQERPGDSRRRPGGSRWRPGGSRQRPGGSGRPPGLLPPREVWVTRDRACAWQTSQKDSSFCFWQKTRCEPSDPGQSGNEFAGQTLTARSSPVPDGFSRTASSRGFHNPLASRSLGCSFL